VRAFEVATHVPLGEAVQPVAVRKGVTGLQIGLADVYWNIKKN
jgi:peptide/nickel transport system substrate-binding protein